MSVRVRNVQSYISTSHDPFLNLSLEHHLLQSSPSDSTILFLYVNRPSIIIGRNQNPWLEVNLELLRTANASANAKGGVEKEEGRRNAIGPIDLVRRRSGGGTVFHDTGNVNWTVICPPATFTRDKHAEMVVRALRNLGVERARVNERHDIVMDQGAARLGKSVDEDDMHVTPFTRSEGDGQSEGDGGRPLKISGSAYKLTRHRALHHGTCLLSSPNLGVIPQYLHSPVRPYIKARGVDSVSSPVGNVGLANNDFQTAVADEFACMYGGELEAEVLQDGLLEVEEVRKGHEELKAVEWTYNQTPQFTFSLQPTADDQRERPAIESLHSGAQFFFKARHGVITEASASFPKTDGAGVITSELDFLKDRMVHEINGWANLKEKFDAHIGEDNSEQLAQWLDSTFTVSANQ
ncbi:hypothetical protein K402DRAFT_409938 [Aulographum hederae CBS 113979]|uniref:Putative lipoate-protein ligase A n=1 Tax=Aulographum hederae CBS 113979 TaxID=1176131 RepID=A0A6G1HCZ8_9PEZI|nr:hypothetical protein K402DRAFT_409938 [Aulographum hederae CBS 113979]